MKERSVVLDHEKLDAYHIAVEFVVLSDAVTEHLPRGRGYLKRPTAKSRIINTAERSRGRWRIRTR